MKKFIIAIIAALLLSGCAAMPPKTDIVLPGYLQRLEARVNNNPGDKIKIVDFRVDEYTTWIWIDNFSMPGSCDYVILGENIDLSKDHMRFVHIFNTETVSPGTDPCIDAYGAYEDYLEAKEATEAQNPQPKEGI